MSHLCQEAMEEKGPAQFSSPLSLAPLILTACSPPAHRAQRHPRFLKDVDCFCISDNYWLGTTKPCITYGLRGITYFYLTVEGTTKDLHSGVFGGTVHEPMIDCVRNVEQALLLPGVNAVGCNVK